MVQKWSLFWSKNGQKPKTAFAKQRVPPYQILQNGSVRGPPNKTCSVFWSFVTFCKNVFIYVKNKECNKTRFLKMYNNYLLIKNTHVYFDTTWHFTYFCKRCSTFWHFWSNSKTWNDQNLNVFIKQKSWSLPTRNNDEGCTSISVINQHVLL